MVVMPCRSMPKSLLPVWVCDSLDVAICHHGETEANRHRLTFNDAWRKCTCTIIETELGRRVKDDRWKQYVRTTCRNRIGSVTNGLNSLMIQVVGIIAEVV